jgi:hypothetical protein
MAKGDNPKHAFDQQTVAHLQQPLKIDIAQKQMTVEHLMQPVGAAPAPTPATPAPEPAPAATENPSSGSSGNKD